MPVSGRPWEIEVELWFYWPVCIKNTFTRGCNETSQGKINEWKGNVGWAMGTNCRGENGRKKVEYRTQKEGGQISRQSREIVTKM
jgi:hypothetical protein